VATAVYSAAVRQKKKEEKRGQKTLGVPCKMSLFERRVLPLEYAKGLGEKHEVYHPPISGHNRPRVSCRTTNRENQWLVGRSAPRGKKRPCKATSAKFITLVLKGKGQALNYS